MSLTLSSSLSACPAFKVSEIKSLQALGVESVESFLRRPPARYEDRRLFEHIPLCATEEALSLKVKVISTQWKFLNKRMRCFDIVVGEEGSPLGRQLVCRWFQFPGISRLIVTGMELILYGKISSFGRMLMMTHPDFEVVEQESASSIHLQRIVPVYRASAGMSQRRYRQLVWSVLVLLDDTPRQKACAFFQKLHFPEELGEEKQARAHFALEECFLIQLAVLQRQRLGQQKLGFETARTSDYIRDLVAKLPFELTSSQKECVNALFLDMKRAVPMNRLLQGDVGSGKTLVALCGALLAIEAGYQVAFMAPTQILAEQHYKTCTRYLEGLDVPCFLLLGGAKKKQEFPLELKGPGLVIGTHALLHQKKVFSALGLVIIDEQHKFGVGQRERLIEQGKQGEKEPDVLVMTATPIPRTLTLTLYGDLDVSLLTEKPAQRGKIMSVVREESAWKKILPFLKEQLEAGRQAYLVSPLVEESEETEEGSTPKRRRRAKSAVSEFELWKERLADFEIGLLHGKMSAEEKEQVMADFRAQRYQLLVATTVIEVGVDVPNATMMMINNADQFGLSQLHQLRGRVGRGSLTSYCILLNSAQATEEKKARLALFACLNDGFELAEEDFKLRGPGDIFGSSQSGLSGLEFSEWLYDTRLLEKARSMAKSLLEKDPYLEKYPHLREKMRWVEALRN